MSLRFGECPLKGVGAGPVWWGLVLSRRARAEC